MSNTQTNVATEKDASSGFKLCRECEVDVSNSINQAGNAEIIACQEGLRPAFVLLRSQIGGKTVHLVLKRMVFEDTASQSNEDVYQDNFEFLESNEFHYNYNCPPSIYLKDIVAVLDEDCFSPRDLFEFLAIKPADFTQDDEGFEGKVKQLFSAELKESPS